MTISVQGVVARGKGEPVELTTVLVPEPGPGEALVTVQACGVCHTDLHYREGGINDDFPFLLGHEGPAWLDERKLPGRFRVGEVEVANRSWRRALEPARAA